MPVGIVHIYTQEGGIIPIFVKSVISRTSKIISEPAGSDITSFTSAFKSGIEIVKFLSRTME
ncbi:hypothetical protein AW40_05060 [Kosakonia radicincitans UMEnt01/12]|nr:hypothetical protein AW40_05060 [Kosakonia radicincitans UMEnt01/12]